MVKVHRKEGQEIEQLISAFEKKVNKTGIMKRCQEKEYYKKPSEIRKEEEMERQKAIRKAQENSDLVCDQS